MRRLYIGIDESWGPNRKAGQIITACGSYNALDIQPRELTKRRDLDPEFLRTNFRYTQTNTRDTFPVTAYANLIQETLKAFDLRNVSIEIYFDGGSPKQTRIAELADLTGIDERNFVFLGKGDERLPVIHRADHLASMLQTIVQNRPVNRDRINRFSIRYGNNLHQKLEECGV